MVMLTAKARDSGGQIVQHRFPFYLNSEGVAGFAAGKQSLLSVEPFGMFT